MGQPDAHSLVVLVLGTLLLTVVCLAHTRRRSLRIKIGIFAVGYFLYSGFGISSLYREEQYILKYFLFFGAFLVGAYLPSLVRVLRGGSLSAEIRPVPTGGDRWLGVRTVQVLAAGFVLATLGQLVVSGGLGAVFRPDVVLVQANQGAQIFAGRVERSSNVLFVGLAYLRLLCLPFFYVQLQRSLSTRWLAQLGVLLAVTYVQVAGAGQWGRATLLQPFAIWLLILLLRGRISARVFALAAAGGFALVIPLLNAVAAWRLGTAGAFSSFSGFGESFRVFRGQELNYPDRYPLAEAMGNTGDYAHQFVTWFVGLPFPGSGTDFSVTKEFSETVLGLPYGAGGFYVVLPSWLGESFIAFGSTYFWIWGLLVGGVVGALDAAIGGREELLTYDAYLTALLLVYLRGVGQEFISQAVGSTWLLLALYVAHRSFRARTRPRSRARPQARVSASAVG